jgi:hypothetical protein
MQPDRVVFLAIGGVLVDADRGAVDHLHIAIVSLGNSVKKHAPDARLAPPVEPVHAGRMRPIARRNISPRRPRPEPPENPVQHPTVIHPRHAPRLLRQQGLDHRPFEIRQIKPSHIKPPRLRRLNHNFARLGILFMGM